MTDGKAPSSLTDAQFHAFAEKVFARVEVAVDRWLQEDVVDIDAQRSGGLLELSLPDLSKLVINTQPPLHEIWLAARRGGYHFKYCQGRWTDTREDREFFETLSSCASEQAKMALIFTAD